MSHNHLCLPQSFPAGLPSLLQLCVLCLHQHRACAEPFSVGCEPPPAVHSRTLVLKKSPEMLVVATALTF